MALKRKAVGSSSGNGQHAAIVERAMTTTPTVTGNVESWNIGTQRELSNITEQLKVLSAQVANPAIQQYLTTALFNLGCAWGYGQLAMSTPVIQQGNTAGIGADA